MEQPRKAVVVTGFGPFGEHTVNASWIAVQELEKLGLGDSVDLHVYEIPVEYQTVQRLIPALWEKHSPQLVVHVGVSGMATTVTLEKCGHNKGYKGLDNCRFCPGSQCCVEDGPESIDSIIDMDAVCKRVTTLGLDVSVTISQDAGRKKPFPAKGDCVFCRQSRARSLQAQRSFSLTPALELLPVPFLKLLCPGPPRRRRICRILPGAGL
ncbi:pyroglutamyl-peptidase 1 isoform X3 [Gorilla gorilla gorilla]|uniref:pyroglutamyl-peptidase 1 isoform X3 n=1 Tax=Gorilla gorilla gorilla TaxID=9595 RepID=UPI0008F49100|nr:pyroglutamyl-peptidase 1 isoform X3 [Gorilla gorilla gorilla]